jgi:hypothetical protein
MIYLNSEFSDDNLRRLRPNFSHFQSQKVRDILEMLTAVTERERKNIIIKEKVNVTCKEMISFFFSHD